MDTIITIYKQIADTIACFIMTPPNHKWVHLAAPEEVIVIKKTGRRRRNPGSPVGLASASTRTPRSLRLSGKKRSRRGAENAETIRWALAIGVGDICRSDRNSFQ